MTLTQMTFYFLNGYVFQQGPTSFQYQPSVVHLILNLRYEISVYIVGVLCLYVHKNSTVYQQLMLSGN